ncbi:hypothetical protein PRIPAC_84028, partial [Pristionchus pacificus]|uniref:Uncharacterized protein n=1 Tax=Pristionchus pacificus TaxID=54126 RepID=A0A2A6BN24_PRIPA
MSGRSHPKYGPTVDRRQSITLVPEGSQNRAAKKDLIGLTRRGKNCLLGSKLDPRDRDTVLGSKLETPFYLDP